MAMSYIDYRIKHRQHQKERGEEKPAAPAVGRQAGKSSPASSDGKKTNPGTSFIDYKINNRKEQVKQNGYERYGTYTASPQTAAQGPMAAQMPQDNPYMKAAVRQMLPAYQRSVDPITAAAANMLRNNARGNIDLYNRPQYRQPDGSISTVNSISIGTTGKNGDKKETLIPTIGRDKNGRPVQWTDEEAIDHYYKTGENLGKFNTVEEANDYAEKLHRQQEAYYSPENSPLRLNNVVPRPYELGDAVQRFQQTGEMYISPELKKMMEEAPDTGQGLRSSTQEEVDAAADWTKQRVENANKAQSDRELRTFDRHNPIIAGALQGTGIPSMLTAGEQALARLTGNEEAQKQSAQMYENELREAQGLQERHPYAFGAGSLAGNIGTMALGGELLGGAAEGIKAPKLAVRAITGGILFGGSTAAHQAGSLATGLMSGTEFARNVGVSTVSGAAQSAAAMATAVGLEDLLRRTGSQTLFLDWVKNLSSATAGAGTRIGIEYAMQDKTPTDLFRKNYMAMHPEATEEDLRKAYTDSLRQQAAVQFGTAFAMNLLSATMDTYKTNSRNFSWLKKQYEDLEKDIELAATMRPANSEDLDSWQEAINNRTQTLRETLQSNYFGGQQDKVDAMTAALDAIDARAADFVAMQRGTNTFGASAGTGTATGTGTAPVPMDLAAAIDQAMKQGVAEAQAQPPAVPGMEQLRALAAPPTETSEAQIPSTDITTGAVTAQRDIPGNPYTRTAMQDIDGAARQIQAAQYERSQHPSVEQLNDELNSPFAVFENENPEIAQIQTRTGEQKLAALAAQATENQAAQKRDQIQAIYEAGKTQNPDFQTVMDSATMLTETEKTDAFYRGLTAAAAEAAGIGKEISYGGQQQEEGNYLSGEGSGRPVSLRAGERVGGVRTQAGRVAEGWKYWSAAADPGIKGGAGKAVTLKRGVPAEEILGTAEPGQVIYQVESGHTPSMKKAAAMVRAYDSNIETVPFVSKEDLLVKGGETSRAFADPQTRRIGYRANDERATGDQLARHELIEFGVMDGKIDIGESVHHLTDQMNALGVGKYVEEIANAYLAGSNIKLDSLSPDELKAAIQHANKEMLCDIGAGINQFEGVEGYEDIAMAVDIAHDILHDYMNEKLGGAFDAEYDETTAPAATAETAAGIGTEATAPSRIVGENPKVEITDKNVSVDSIVPTITEMPKNLPEYSSTLYREPAQKELFTLSKDGDITVKEKLNMSGRDFLIKQMKEKGYRDKKNTLAWLDKTADFMDKAETVYTYIGLDDIKNTKLVIDPRSGNIVLRALVKNGEYPVNIDLTKECTRRIALGKFVDWLSRNAGRKGGKTMLEEVPLTASNLVLFNKILKDEGFDTACLGCFVETRRYRIQEWADSFIEKYNNAVEKNNPGADYFNFADKNVYVSDLSKKDLADLNEALESYKANVKEERNAKKAFAKAEKERLKSIGATKKQIDDVKSELSNEEKINALVRSNKIYQKKLRVSDLITPGGRTVLHRDFPELESLVLGHYGSNTPKSVELFTPYNYDLGSIQAVGKQTLQDYVAPIGGAREQSFSDSVPTHLMDQMEKTADMAVNKLPDHIYTKVPSEVMLFGLTRRKFNMSIMFNIDPDVDSAHAGLRADGSYFVGDRKTSELEAKAGRERTFVQSFPYDMAKKIQHMPGYSKNCGMIGVGYSYFHIKKMLADPEFGYLIGYHPSGMNGELASASYIEKATSYEPVQNTLKIKGLRHVTGELDGLPSYASWPQGTKTTDNKMIEKTKFTMKDFDMKGNLKKYGGKETMRRFLAWLEENRLAVDTSKASYDGVEQHGVGSFPLYKDLAKTKDYRKTADNYITWCLENDMLPEFYEFADDDNYFNFIYDYTPYDHNTGKYSPQLPVQMIFPDNFFKLANHALNQWNNYMMRQEPKEIPTFERMYNEAVQYSSKLDLSGKQGASGQRDSSGKTLTAQQAEYFKDSKIRDEDGNLLVVYHGTSEDFNVFDSSKGRANMDIQGSFFSPWDIDAKGYGPNVKTVYLNIKNPAPEGIAYKALNMFKGQNNAGVKAREYLIRRGYDGVNNGNEEYIAFYPEQIKNIDNENPTENADIRYSSKLQLQQKRDEDYSAAIRENDTETAGRLVKEAAEDAGYTEDIYHGTGAFGFTKFDLGKMDDGASIFATTDRRVAESYSGETNRELISKRAGESVDAIIDRIDGAKDEDLLPLIKENLDPKYKRVPQERLAEMRDERVNDIRFYADKIMDFMDDNPGMFDEAKSIAASRLASSMYKLSRAQSADEVDEYLTQYNEDAWELKFMDEDAFYEMFDGSSGIAATNNAIRDLGSLLESDVMFTNGEKKPGSTLDVLTPGEARTRLIGEMSKGIYHLYGKKENMLEFDANGDNWNMIDTARISNKAFRIKSTSNKDKAWLSGLYMPYNDAQSLAARAARDANGEDDYLDVKDLRDPLGKISGWEFRSHKTGEMVMELESALPSRAMTRDIAKYAREVGYDGVIMRNLKDSGGATAYNHPSDVYIYFKPNAVKSADTVTYDDGGNAIPLSERFKTGEDDIRYSSKLDLRRKQERDNEYMDAVNTGDIAKAAKMVSKAAEEAGFKNAIPEQTLAYKVRTGKAPAKTKKVYKVFTVAPDGAPTALFVSGTQKLPQGVWLDAQDTWHFKAKNGKYYVPSTQNPYTEGGKTGGMVEIPNEEIRNELIERGFLPEGSKAKSVTALAYRPGWHAGDLPFFPQGGKQDKEYVSESSRAKANKEVFSGTEEHPYQNYHRYNQVVFECEMAFDKDYTKSHIGSEKGKASYGKVVYEDMQEMPVDGGYKFATNPMANANDIGSWFISGSLKIGRALSQEECDTILRQNGRLPQLWEQGKLDLASLGYTGPQKDAARKTLAPVTYDDEGNVIPLSERFNAENEDIRYSTKLDLPEKENAPTFYSKLQREIENYKGEKIGAASVESYLKGKGVKDEEIKWSGIRTFLEGKKSVNKQELMQYLRDNELQIEEKILGGETDNGEWTNGYNTVNVNYFYDPVSGMEFKDEESFRKEALKKAAEDHYDESELVFNISDDYMSVESEDGDVIFEAYPPDTYELRDSDYSPVNGTKWESYKLDGGKNYREILFSIPGSDYINGPMRTHWKGDTGVLAHARVQDFETEDGGKVLFVEEIQSDWHNAGQKHGYSNDFNVVEGEYGQWLLKDANGKTVAKTDQLYTKERAKEALMNQVRNKVAPDAPFRTTYTDYVLKNLLRMAAEGDYDYLAWTTGKMQEKRWSDEFAEGYRIEYDQQIPKFLKKYGKQWDAGLTEVFIDTDWHSVEIVPAITVNDAMKESVLTEGQPMYSTKLNLNGREVELTDREEELMDQLNSSYLDRIDEITQQKDAEIAALQEKMERAVGEEKKKARDRLERLRKQKNDRIAYLEKQWRENTNRRIADLKEKAKNKLGEQHDDMMRRLAKLQAQKDKKIEDILAEHRRQRQEARDKRNDHKLRVKFQKLAQRAVRDSKNKPGMASQRVQELLKDIDLKALGMRDETKWELRRKYQEILEMKEKDENYAALFADRDMKKVERLFKTQINEMSVEDINDLITELSALAHYQENTDRLLKDSQGRSAAEVGRQIVKDLKELSPLEVTNPVKRLSAKYLRDNLSPERAFNRLSGYKHDNAMKTFYRTQILDGLTKVKRFEQKADELKQEFINGEKNKYFLNNGSKQTIPVTDKYGRTAMISPAMRVSLYMASKNADNLRHIATDGVTVPEPKTYAKGMIEDAYGRGTTLILDPTDVKAICNGMTDSEKEFATLLKIFFDTYAKDAINETSVDLDGILRATVENYFPITSDKNFLAKSMDSFQDPTLEGWNNLKSRQENANNRILLEDARQVLQRHIRNTARYHGLAVPMRNWSKVYGYTSHRDEATGTRNSVQSAIKNAWDADTADYIERLIRDDINSGGRKAERGIADAMRSAYAGATLTLNPSVALKQTTSYLMAGSILDSGSLMYGLAHGFTKKDEAYMDSITPWGWARRQGESTIELGDLARKMDPITKNTPNWNQAMDVWTTNRLFLATEESVKKEFKASKNEVLHDLKRGDKKYDDAVAERYNQVLWRTQPQYEAAFRPEYLRKTDVGSRTFGLFKTESMQMSGELIDAWGQWKADEKRTKDAKGIYDKHPGDQTKTVYETNEKYRKDSAKQFYRTFCSWVASNMLFSIMGTGLNILLLHKGKPYRNDKGEIDWQTIAMKTGQNFIGSSLGGFFYASTAMDIGAYLYGKLSGDNPTWYDIEVPGISLMNDAVENMGNLTGVLTNEEANNAAKAQAIAKFALAVSKFTPVGFAENIVNLANSVVLYNQDKKEGTLGKWEAGKGLLKDTSPTRDQYANRAVDAARKGDMATAERALKKTKKANLEKAVGRPITENMYKKIMEDPNNLRNYLGVALEDMTPSIKNVPDHGYSSFTKLREDIGDPERTQNWHHIVEQEQMEEGLAGFKSTQVNNTNNIVSIPSGSKSPHSKISEYYGSVQDFTDGKTVREWLKDKSFEEQWEFGVKQLREYGDLVPTTNGWVFVPDKEKMETKIPMNEGKAKEKTDTQRSWESRIAEAREDGSLKDNEIRTIALDMIREGISAEEAEALYRDKKKKEVEKLDKWIEEKGTFEDYLKGRNAISEAAAIKDKDKEKQAEKKKKAVEDYLRQYHGSYANELWLWELAGYSENTFEYH